MQTKSYISLSRKLNIKKHTIGIVGLGYVGLPLVKRFIKSGCKKIFGVDSDVRKVKLLKNGISPIDSINIKYFKKNKEKVSTNYFVLNQADIIVICLPTPLKSKNIPDLKYLDDCYKNLSKIDIKDKIIILESTVYPGVTKKLADQLVSKEKALIIGKNIFFGYSPERENPGDKGFSYQKTPKVISGYSKNCSKLMKRIYGSIAKKTYHCDTLEEAETSKLLENLYRSINIGLANEMKLICNKLGINVHSVIESAATKNFGFQKFIPGPGLGGHCIPIDPYYLSWISEKKGYEPRLLKSAAQINNSMPKVITNKILSYFNKKPKILIFGVSYKKNVDDDRESPSFEFMNIFKKKGIKFDYFDPFFPKIKKGRKIISEKKSIKLNLKNVKNYDCGLIITDHDIYDYNFIKKNFKYVFDARGVFFRKKMVSPNIIQV